METPQEPAIDTTTWMYVSSILAMTALFFFGVAVPSGIAFGWPAGIGLGAMCAVWGGPGFGLMAAGARAELAHERVSSARERSESVVVWGTRLGAGRQAA